MIGEWLPTRVFCARVVSISPFRIHAGQYAPPVRLVKLAEANIFRRIDDTYLITPQQYPLEPHVHGYAFVVMR